MCEKDYEKDNPCCPKLSPLKWTFTRTSFLPCLLPKREEKCPPSSPHLPPPVPAKPRNLYQTWTKPNKRFTKWMLHLRVTLQPTQSLSVKTTNFTGTGCQWKTIPTIDCLCKYLSALFQSLYVADTRPRHTPAEPPCSNAKARPVDCQVVESRSCPPELGGSLCVISSSFSLEIQTRSFSAATGVPTGFAIQEDIPVLRVITPHMAVPPTLNASTQELQATIRAVDVRDIDIVFL